MPDSNPLSRAPSVALIGFGEAGERFAVAGGWADHASGWDIAADRRAAMAEHGIACDSPKNALRGAQIVLSLVTADAAVGAAQEYAQWLHAGALWCDMNSVAPETKRKAAAAIEAAAGRYVDVAVMAPVGRELSVPLLVAGPHAAEAAELLAALGFEKITLVEGEVGKASAIKMIRSVMVKGIEALSRECSDAAAAAGVLDDVAASLDASETAMSWAQRFAYNRERMEKHGLRRAAEMEESAKTLQGLGIEPVMTRSTVRLQREVGTKYKTKEIDCA